MGAFLYLLYIIIPFVVLSSGYRYFRGYSSIVRPIAIATLFFFFLFGIIFFFGILEEIELDNDKNQGILKSSYNEAFLKWIQDDPLMFLILLIFLTIIFKGTYLKFLKIENN